MPLIAPDLFAPMRDLPLAAASVVTAVGVCLWFTGWWAHRFWLALGATLGAGVAGLRLGPSYGVEPMVAGLLAAVAAGGLALSLARVAVFIGCGAGCWYVAQMVIPKWTEPLVCVLAGGLAGVLLFRFCIMLATSLAGTTLTAYGGLTFANQVVGFPAEKWLNDSGTLVVIGYGVVVLLGVVVQYLIDRSWTRYKEWKKEIKEWQAKQNQEEKPSWFQRLRRAG